MLFRLTIKSNSEYSSGENAELAMSVEGDN